MIKITKKTMAKEKQPQKSIGGKTLLEMARELDTTKSSPITVGPQEVELALAWARGEIRQTQLIKVLSQTKKYPNVYAFLARALRQHIINEDQNQ